jgi:4-hydroxy-2-oxoglutarate aldolase
MLKLNGIFPPLPTSFNDNEEVAHDLMTSNIKLLSRYDLRGFLVLGSNGEMVNLFHQERVEIFENARKAIPPDKLMLAGTGCQSTLETIKLSEAAANAGADAVLVLNPSYYKGLMSRDALVRHYHDVAGSINCPLIIYNMPANSGLDMDAATVVAIAEHPNIIGLKDSGGNLVKMGTIITKVKPGFQVLAGSAGFLLPALSIGAVGGILALANIAPSHCIDVYNEFNSGNFELAKKLQLKLVELNTAVTRKWGVPALKATMEMVGLYGGMARRPVLPLNDHIKNQLSRLAEDAGLDKIL